MYWMISGLLNRFHGVMKMEPMAASMPPMRQLMRDGATLEKSNAGDTKLATMLMPMVASTRVRMPSAAATPLSMRATVSIGSCSISPKMGCVPDTTTTVMTANSRKLTGRPQKLPRFTSPGVAQ